GGTFQSRTPATTLNNSVLLGGNTTVNIGNQANNGGVTLTVNGGQSLGAFTLTTAATTATSTFALTGTTTLTGAPTFAPVAACTLQFGALTGAFNMTQTGVGTVTLLSAAS